MVLGTVKQFTYFNTLPQTITKRHWNPSFESKELVADIVIIWLFANFIKYQTVPSYHIP